MRAETHLDYKPSPVVYDEQGNTYEVVHALAVYRDMGGTLAAADTFLIDGILTDKVSLFASYPGKGKTSVLCTLAMIVSNLITCGPELRVRAMRSVIYISEHPEQVEKILRVLAQANDIPWVLICERIRLVDAARMSPEAMVLVAPDYLRLARPATRNGVTVAVKPWVIVDTFSSVFDIEDENSNAAISRLIATLKQGFGDIPITVVMHTSKAHKHGKAEDLTTRGASSAEGDVHQVMFLSDDGESGARYIEIAIPKHRFVAKVDSIRVESNIGHVLVENAWGEQYEEAVLWCWLAGMSKTQRQHERDADKDEANALKAKAEKKAADKLDGEVLAYIRKNPGTSANGIVASVIGKESLLRASAKRLVMRGDARIENGANRTSLHYATPGCTRDAPALDDADGTADQVHPDQVHPLKDFVGDAPLRGPVGPPEGANALRQDVPPGCTGMHRNAPEATDPAEALPDDDAEYF